MLAENEFPVGMLYPSLQAVIEEVSIITKAPRSMIAVTLLSVITRMSRVCRCLQNDKISRAYITFLRYKS